MVILPVTTELMWEVQSWMFLFDWNNIFRSLLLNSAKSAAVI